MSSTSGAILAGGKSSRFGSPKVSAVLDGRSFGERIVATLRASQILDLFLVGGSRETAEDLGIEFVEDAFVDSGPFGALISVMRVCRAENVLILPCDVPFIDRSTCEALAEFDDSFEVQVASTDSPQWLCSNWKTSTLPTLERRFVEGERAIHNVAPSLKMRTIEVSHRALRNINSPTDLE
ncbi:MAG: molybdenum cofactor guanylyltransferase [Actinobacteria bacterium]|nr:molybdenum cofactor guanylyltransferase [Actinomycetota bacterium]